MEILVKRNPKSDYTPGVMTIQGDNTFKCYTLEDPQRFIKVEGDTCIPKGRYEVILNMSNRFNQYMPLLLNVRGFEGVRIHWGNTKIDTHGCILVGNEDSSDGFMGASREAYNALMARLKLVEKKEKIWISIS